jgi:hypothetical protein
MTYLPVELFGDRDVRLHIMESVIFLSMTGEIAIGVKVSLSVPDDLRHRIAAIPKWVWDEGLGCFVGEFAMREIENATAEE